MTDDLPNGIPPFAQQKSSKVSRSKSAFPDGNSRTEPALSGLVSVIRTLSNDAPNALSKGKPSVLTVEEPSLRRSDEYPNSPAFGLEQARQYQTFELKTNLSPRVEGEGKEEIFPDSKATFGTKKIPAYQLLQLDNLNMFESFPGIEASYCIDFTTDGKFVSCNSFDQVLVFTPFPRPNKVNFFTTQHIRKSGTSQGQIRFLAVDRFHQNEIYICAELTSSLFVYNLSGQLLREINLPIAKPMTPHAICFKSSTEMIVADNVNRLLYVMDRKGNLLQIMGGSLSFAPPQYPQATQTHTKQFEVGTWPAFPTGSSIGNPRQIAYDNVNDLVYVIIRNTYRFGSQTEAGEVNVFNSKGSLIRSWGRGLFGIPHGLAFDATSDIVYVGNTGGDKVQAFTAKGQFLAYHDYPDPRYMFLYKGLLYVASQVKEGGIGVFALRTNAVPPIRY